MGRGDAPVVVSFAQLLGRSLVVRELLDGEPTKHDVLDDRYEIHGWSMTSTRTVYYDALPDWFVACDVYDREREAWLATRARRELLTRASLRETPVLHDGTVRSIKALHAMIAASRCKTPRWRESLRAAADECRLDVDAVVLAIDPLDLAMGLLVDVEDGDVVIERHELVRPSFGSAVLVSEAPLGITNAIARGGA